MAPFHLPWSTFAAFLALAGAVVLALVWAWCDRRAERKDGS